MTQKGVSWQKQRKLWQKIRNQKAIGFLNKLRRRQYVSPSGYPSIDDVLKELAALLYVIDLEIDDLDMGQRKTGMVLSRLFEQDYPTFWVTPPLAEALKQTRLPKLDYGTLPLFMQSGLIILPDDATLESDNGGKVKAIAFRFVEQSEYLSMSISLPKGVFDCQIADTETRRKLIYTSVSLSGDGLYWTGMIGLGANTISTGDTYEMVLADGSIVGEKSDERLISEGQHMEGIVHLILNLCLLKAANPELFDREDVLSKIGGQRMQGVSGVGFKPAVDLWAPRWIGRDYQVKTNQDATSNAKEENELSRHSPRPHWRSGHHRPVWKGKGRTVLSSVWIEPVYVNAHRIHELNDDEILSD